MREIQNTAIVGMGAIGAAYAMQISKNAPDVQFWGIVRDIELYWGLPIVVNEAVLKANYRTADTLVSVPLDLVVFCVKSYQLRDAVRALNGVIGKDTLVMTLSSGLEGESILSAAFGEERVVYASLYGADSKRNGHYISLSQLGTLYYGAKTSAVQERLPALSRFFKRANIRCVETDKIDYYKWKQLLISAAYWPVSTMYRLTNGEFISDKNAMELMRAVQREIVRLGNLNGVALSEADIVQVDRELAHAAADDYSPMLHDLWQNRKMETEALCEYICTLGERFEADMPATQWVMSELTQNGSRMSVKQGNITEIKGYSVRKGINPKPEEIADQLRLSIIRSDLKPDDKIAEPALAERFNASRSSVRAALQTLTVEGLLKAHPNGRREVLPFSDRNVQDIYDLRSMLESRAAEILLRQDMTSYPQVMQAIGRIEQKYYSSSDNSTWQELDVVFHRSLLEATDNFFLLKAWENSVNIWYSINMLRAVNHGGGNFATKFFGDHRHIYELLLAKDRSVLHEIQHHIAEEKSSALLAVRHFRSQ